MGMRHQQGFTIIEVLLFLGITGLLAVTLLGGWTTMINTQRYQDSLKTTQAFIQQQYNLVYNVQNGRADTLRCTAGAGPTDEPTIVDDESNGISPGQSTNCIVMGRYIHISNGSNMKVYAIVGKDGDTETIQSDDDAILDRNPVRVQNEMNLTESEQTIPWQARVVAPGTTDSMDGVIMIIRSPESGAVHTYAWLSNETLPSVKDVISNWQPLSNTDINLCLEPDVFITGERKAVVIKSGASSQSFVQTVADSEDICD